MEDLLSVCSAFFGLILFFKSKQRRFQRTNQFGVEVFTSYLSKLANRLLDEALLGLGLLFFAFGTITLVSKYAEDMFWLTVLILAAVAIESFFYSDRRKMNHVKHIK